MQHKRDEIIAISKTAHPLSTLLPSLPLFHPVKKIMIFNSLPIATMWLTMITSGVFATMAPSYPDPGAIWTAGKQYNILWGKVTRTLCEKRAFVQNVDSSRLGDDGKSPSVNESWTNFKIGIQSYWVFIC